MLVFVCNRITRSTACGRRSQSRFLHDCTVLFTVYIGIFIDHARYSVNCVHMYILTKNAWCVAGDSVAIGH